MGGPRAPLIVPAGHQRCANSNHVKPFDCFGTNPKTGGLNKNCQECLEKCRSHAKSVAGTAWTEKRKKDPEYLRKQREAKATVRATEEGHATEAASNKKWRNSDGGKVYRRKYLDSVDGVLAVARGKVAWKANPKSRIANKRGHATSRKKMKTDPGYKLRLNMLSRISKIICKKRKTSKTLIKHTMWTDCRDLYQHFAKQMEGEWTMATHGKNWVVGHRVPLCYFDHSVASEVTKAWSAANMCPMTWKRNSELGIKINDAICMEAGVEVFPEWWKGTIPSPEEKRMLYSKVWKNEAPWGDGREQ